MNWQAVPPLPALSVTPLAKGGSEVLHAPPAAPPAIAGWSPPLPPPPPSEAPLLAVREVAEKPPPPTSLPSVGPADEKAAPIAVAVGLSSASGRAVTLTELLENSASPPSKAPREVLEHSIGALAAGAGHWHAPPTFQGEAVGPHVPYWNPYVQAARWPGPGQGLLSSTPLLQSNVLPNYTSSTLATPGVVTAYHDDLRSGALPLAAQVPVSSAPAVAMPPSASSTATATAGGDSPRSVILRLSGAWGALTTQKVSPANRNGRPEAKRFQETSAVETDANALSRQALLKLRAAMGSCGDSQPEHGALKSMKVSKR